MISSLNSRLVAANVGSGADANRFALVGYGNGITGGANSGRLLGGFGTTGAFATAAGSLVLSGGTEDGYAGINYAFNTLSGSFRSGAAVNVILVTDEDRDNTNSALTFESTRSLLQGSNALLNVVVNNPFTGGLLGAQALGVSVGNRAYFADGLGGFTSDSPGTVGNGAGSTETDYVALALGLDGAAWNLNLLREGGLTAQSFTSAFIDIKVGEILQQTPNNPGGGAVPEPSTYGLMGAVALLGAVIYRRRVAAKKQIAS